MLFNTPKRIAISGLKSSGKTVFLANLLNYLRLGAAVANYGNNDSYQFNLQKYIPYGISPRNIAPNMSIFPDDSIKIFELIKIIDDMKIRGIWPSETMDISRYPCEISLQNRETSKVTKKDYIFFDYPGEYLCDLVMADMSFDDWSIKTIEQINEHPFEEFFKEFIQSERESSSSFEILKEKYLKGIREAFRNRYHYLTPIIEFSRSNQERIGLPNLEFFPTTHQDKDIKRKCQKGFNEYKKKRVNPFLSFLKSCDHHVFLISLFSFLEHPDPQDNKFHYNDQRQFIKKIFEPLCTRRWLNIIKPIKKIDFVATKADLLLESHRDKLQGYMREFIGQVMNHVATRSKNISMDSFCASIVCTDFEKDANNNYSIVSLADRKQRFPYIIEGDGSPPNSIRAFLMGQYNIIPPPSKPLDQIGLFPHYKLSSVAEKIF